MPDTLKYNKLAGTRILVLGGTSGIGYAVAEAALEAGASAIIISSSNPEKIEKSIGRLKSSYPDLSSHCTITGKPCDLADITKLEDNIKALLAFATDDDKQQLDHIVNTAGDFKPQPALHDVDALTVRDAGISRFTAAVMLAKHATLPAGPNSKTPLAPGPKSSITLTSGSTAEKPYPGRTYGSGYAAALQGVTKGLAVDLAPVRVNLVLPGAVETELWNFMPKEQRSGFLQHFSKECLTGVVHGPEMVAEAYVYAMKDANITGSCVSSNGGALLSRPKMEVGV